VWAEFDKLEFSGYPPIFYFVITEQKARQPCFLGEESRPLFFCPGIKGEILRQESYRFLRSPE